MKRKLVTLSAVNCILIAGACTEANDQQDVARTRKLIRKEGTKTTPGWRWIAVGDTCHPDSREIYRMSEKVIHQFTRVGYTRETAVAVPESTTRVF
ncbi:hypothetical protein CsSME_00010454 [Camellia sinensis var. sinensis]